MDLVRRVGAKHEHVVQPEPDEILHVRVGRVHEGGCLAARVLSQEVVEVERASNGVCQCVCVSLYPPQPLLACFACIIDRLLCVPFSFSLDQISISPLRFGLSEKTWVPFLRQRKRLVRKVNPGGWSAGGVA